LLEIIENKNETFSWFISGIKRGTEMTEWLPFNLVYEVERCVIVVLWRHTWLIKQKTWVCESKCLERERERRKAISFFRPTPLKDKG